MTPTLFGRWQTRLLLLTTVGLLVSLPFALGLVCEKPTSIYLWVLGYVALFGVVWDVLYIYLQQFRWDRDWPGVFQLFAGISEGVILAVLINSLGLPGIPQNEFDLGLFVLHYSLVWLTTYLASQSLMRILFPYWRFRGGKWY